jgi:hypothetical protein
VEYETTELLSVKKLGHYVLLQQDDEFYLFNLPYSTGKYFSDFV